MIVYRPHEELICGYINEQPVICCALSIRCTLLSINGSSQVIDWQRRLLSRLSRLPIVTTKR